MTYPDNFYYDEEQNDALYEYTPPGQLDVPRLIKKEKCWRGNGSISESKRKTLILSDWTASIWPAERIHNNQQILLQLLKDGFVIYLQHNKALIPLTTNTIANLSIDFVRHAIKPTFPNDLINQAVSHFKLSGSDTVFVLDDYQLKLLSGDPMPFGRTLDSDACIKLHQLNPQRLSQILLEARPTIEAILMSSYSNVAWVTALNIESMLQPKGRLKKSYQHLTLNEADLKELIDKNKPYLGEELRYNCTIDRHQIQEITALSFAPRINLANYLEPLLAMMPNLTQLNLNDCKQLDIPLKPPIRLPHLREISLQNTAISPENLTKLLADAKQLEILNINDCTNITTLPNTLNLPFIHTLNLNNSRQSKESMETLLSNRPNLKNLLLDMTNHLDIPLNASILFPALQQLSVVSSNITTENLEQLLNKTEALIELDVSYCNNLTAPFSVTPNVKHLNKLTLSRSSLSVNNTFQLLKCAESSLRILNMDDLNTLDIPFKTPLTLSSLIELTANNTLISTENLQTLLCKATQLLRLELAQCTNLISPFTEELNLPDLSVIYLNDSHISIDNLRKLLANTRHLNELNLNSSEIEDDFTQFFHPLSIDNLLMNHIHINPFNLKILLQSINNLKTLDLEHIKGLCVVADSFDFSTMKTLKLASSDISDRTLERFLCHAQKLKTLELNECDRLLGGFSNNINLPSLETLNMSRCSLIESIGLEKLLHNTRRLKELDLSHVKGLNKPFTKKMNLSSLEILCLAATDISTENLQSILEQAPNLQEIHLYTCYNFEITDPIKSLLKPIQTVHLGKKHSGYRLNQTREKIVPEVTQLIDPIHDPLSHLNNKPIDDNFHFEYQGTNPTKNQAMIIEQLAQYLTLTHQHLHYIPKIQNGICQALAALFKQTSISEWENLIDHIAQWDGTIEHLTPNGLSALDKILQAYQAEYQLPSFVNPDAYLGDNLQAFLDNKKDCILRNPWHGISIKFLDNNTCAVYDPNFVKGYRIIPEKELLPTIHDSLGTLVSVRNHSRLIPEPGILNAATFIRTGGLLVLTHTDNPALLIEKLSNTPFESLSRQDLDGLLLRDTKGYPAWVKGIKYEKTNAYFAKLLEACAAIPGYEQPLVNSLQALNPEAQHECIQSLRNLQDANELTYSEKLNTSIDSICQIMHRSLQKDDLEQYEHFLETWKREKSSLQSTPAYCQKLTQNSGEKRLIELTSTKSVQAMNLALQAYCIKTSRPFFCINTPSDLICSSPTITHVGKSGTLCDGPGGPLYQFLTEPQKPGTPSPILIVNYEQFTPSEIIRFNALLDDARKADGTALPPNLSIIGLTNPNNPSHYDGADFYGRFDLNGVESCPIEEIALLESIPPLPIITKTPTTQTQLIQLFNAPNWQDTLLGYWIIQKDQMIFQEGELISALKTGLPLEIANGLWANPKFNLFWQQAILRGYIDYEGQHIEIPATLKLVQSQGYDWKTLTKNIDWRQEFEPGAPILNPYELQSFFSMSPCDNTTKTLLTLPGILKKHANKPLTVNITRDLDPHQWAQFLTECQKYNITLSCRGQLNHAPEELMALQPMREKSVNTQTLFQKPKESTAIIQSSDIDTTVLMLTEGEDNWEIIDVSECHASSLLDFMKGELKHDPLHLEFEQTERAVLTALKAKKKVLLKGQFNPALSDALTTLILSRKHDPSLPGKLWLVTPETDLFTSLTPAFHQVQRHEKREQLLKKFKQETVNQLDESLLEKESLSKLSAQLINPDPWKGMKTALPRNDLPDFDEKTSQSIAETFIQHRLDAVNAALNTSPFIFLTGSTAVGKTTFVEKYLPSDTTVLYQSEKNLSAWACDTSDKRKILFIDEANITSRQWSEFEGLFNQPPGILINGTYHPLTPQHKVIFAGNPLSYGGERKLAPLFERHGNALLFEPMPQGFIFEVILKPLFNNSGIDEKGVLEASKAYLDIYRFLCNRSDKDILITPRELQTMALLTIAYQAKHPESNPADLARYYAHLVAKDLIPDELKTEFEHEFSLPPRTVEESPLPGFVSTKSRQPIIQQLRETLGLRDIKQKKGANNLQQYGGLGGVMLEGLPGDGKSVLVRAVLREEGYQEVSLNTPSDQVPERACYFMPVSMQGDEKEKLLRKAFNEGAVVVIDEINSAPMMERLLNELLTGKTPEGAHPNKAGFMIIGTQNSKQLAGRKASSTAFSRRVMTIQTPPYPQPEIEKILVEKGLSEYQATRMTTAYIKKLDEATQHRYKPAPTFRNLNKLANKILKHFKTNALESLKATTQQLIDKWQDNRSSSYQQQRFFPPLNNVMLNELKQQISAAKDVDCFEKVINDYLIDPKTNYDEHSFTTALLKSLSRRENTIWYKLPLNNQCVARDAILERLGSEKLNAQFNAG